MRSAGRLVFLCLQPNERDHVEIMREICERWLFVFQGRLSEAPDFPTRLQDEWVCGYLGHLAAPEV